MCEENTVDNMARAFQVALIKLENCQQALRMGARLKPKKPQKAVEKVVQIVTVVPH